MLRALAHTKFDIMTNGVEDICLARRSKACASKNFFNSTFSNESFNSNILQSHKSYKMTSKIRTYKFIERY